MKNKKSIFLLFIILFISIGFALLSTNLNLNGLVGFSKSSWDVHFDDISILSNDINASFPTIDAENTSISFGGTFKQPGEVFEFNVDVVNDGTIDAMINTLLKTGITADNSDYLNYEVKYYDGSEIRKYDFIGRNSRTRINVKVEFNYDVDIIPTLSGQNFTLTLEYASATSDAVDRNNTFYLSESSSAVTVANAKSNSMHDLKIYGKSDQKVYTGQNLLNYRNNPSTGIVNASANSEGWIHISYNNTNGNSTVYPRYYINNLDIDPNTNYLLVLEIKYASGTGKLFPITRNASLNEGQFTSEVSYDFSTLGVGSIKTNVITSIESFDNITSGVRCHAAFAPGQSGEIIFRLSIIKDTTVTKDNFVYEPYVGEKVSPSIEYPQEINNLHGDTKIKFLGKNLLNYNNISNIAKNFGIQVDSLGNISDSTPAEDKRYWTYEYCNFYVSLNPGTYSLSLIFSEQSNQPNHYDDLRIMSSDNETILRKSIHGVDELKCTFTLKEKTKIGIIAKSYTGVYKIQLEEGEKTTEWDSYIEKVYPISLNGMELNGIGDYKDYIHNIKGKWYLHKEINKQIFDGTEDYVIDDSVNGIYQFSTKANYDLKDDDEYKKYVLSNNFLGMLYHDSWLNDDTVITRTYQNKIRFNTSRATTLQEFKNFLSNHNSKIYYVIDKPEELEIDDQNLINQLNSVIEDNLTDDYNYVFYESSVNASIDFCYKNK